MDPRSCENMPTTALSNTRKFGNSTFQIVNDPDTGDKESFSRIFCQISENLFELMKNWKRLFNFTKYGKLTKASTVVQRRTLLVVCQAKLLRSIQVVFLSFFLFDRFWQKKDSFIIFIRDLVVLFYA